MSRVGQAILPTPSIGVVVGDKKQMVPPQLPVKPQIVANAELEQPKLSTLQVNIDYMCIVLSIVF